MNAISPEQIELDPIQVDSRPCLCGRTIDQHRMVDIGEGPEFFCDGVEYQIHLDAADLVRQWELADPRDAWRHTGEAPPLASVRNSDISAKPSPTRPYRAAESTIAAFWHVVSLNDLKYLKAWLANHPTDAPTLLKLLESK